MGFVSRWGFCKIGEGEEEERRGASSGKMGDGESRAGRGRELQERGRESGCEVEEEKERSALGSNRGR